MKIMQNKMVSRANAALDSKWTGLCLAVVGLLMMAFGIFRGEMAVVFGVYRNWIRKWLRKKQVRKKQIK